tara:strand:+ start:1744 stop:2706 length:963 start_codon:yes stop_codon:yes gene_type:complete
MSSKMEKQLTCSSFSESVGEQIFGTAPMWNWCICIEAPFPWQSNVLQSNFFQKHLLIDDLTWFSDNMPGLRIQAINADDNHTKDSIRVLSFKEQDNHIVKTEYLFPEFEFKKHILALINGTDQQSLDIYAKKEQNTQDYLICTHGNRDFCCGFWGYQLYKELSESYSSESIRFWRTSHLGGHRFAPTLLSLDDARYWGRIKPEHFTGITQKNMDQINIKKMYRGKATCSSLTDQLIEKEFFSEFKWNLDNSIITSELISHNEPYYEHLININNLSSPANKGTEYKVNITRKEDILRYGCTLDQTYKPEEQYDIVSVSQIN